MRLYEIKEYNAGLGRWETLVRDVVGIRDAQIIAHHEKSDEPVQINRQAPVQPVTLRDYSGNDAAALRRAWVDAGSPDYHRPVLP
jgi:hypothetical protein